MDLKKLLTKKCTTLHEEYIGGSKLAVKETADYRWFECGGQGIQSLMSLHEPEKILTPVTQSLLLFLLWTNKPVNVLNLGLGGATLERALANQSSLSITSVEVYPSVIDVAKRFFKLDHNAHVVCQSAEIFIKSTENRFDIIVCDLFVDEQNPDFLFSEHFYVQLKNITQTKSVVMLNIQAETDHQLLSVLFEMKKNFPYIALIEFSDYKNIVVVCSSHEIPSRDVLQASLMAFKRIDLSALSSIIPYIRYIPHN
jgi:hypothetical protein